MTLVYHQATFDLIGKTPRTTKKAVAALEKRERLLGIRLPASMREFYSLTGACEILTGHSNEDPAVPLEELGDAQDLAHGVLRIQDENQGVAAWYVRLDGSDDPPVEVESEADRADPPEGLDPDADSFWVTARFRPVSPTFSAYVLDRVRVYGGDATDHRIASRLKPMGFYIEFDANGRATRATLDPNFAPPKPNAKPFDARVAMGLVRALDQLERLEISSKAIDERGWAALRDHPSILDLEDHGSLTDAAVDHIAAMPALRGLSISGVRLTDRGFARLLGARDFSALSVGMGGRLTPGGLAALASQTRLERLSLTDFDGALTDEGLAGLAGLTSMRYLEIVSPEVSDDGLRHLTGLVHLEDARLYLDRVTDAGLASLAGWRKLVRLRLGRSTRVLGPGLRHLAGLRCLRELDLMRLPVDDDSLVHLAGLVELEDLNLRETRAIGPGFAALSGLANLRRLDCRWSGVTDQAMPHIAGLPALEKLDIAGAKVSDAGLLTLSPLRSLRVLDLTGVTIGADAIRGLKAAIPSLDTVFWTRPGGRPDTGNPFDFRAGPGLG
ncbi:Leucine Rich repeats (2 copies) [Aquisphaera giovannonii]|uniref:Leucine Rich repeats (2 copies) n=1 Tax=Aquisphaera giovannonii TaxID=406548 RepID=A0A5B9VWT6_9BACT|nr:hypothetical protein [Aquisphaera giovannonii]QEH32728.1 Leucine Rich repeats (2 copies) [Aquisphaera giovannonii]